MSRVENCYDNAVMESSFSTLKLDCVTGQFASRSQVRTAIFEYIEVWYNQLRLHSSLGYLSPEEFEQATVIVSATWLKESLSFVGFAVIDEPIYQRGGSTDDP